MVGQKTETRGYSKFDKELLHSPWTTTNFQKSIRCSPRGINIQQIHSMTHCHRMNYQRTTIVTLKSYRMNNQQHQQARLPLRKHSRHAIHYYVVRMQKILSSAIFRTCYSLSVRKNYLTYMQPTMIVFHL